MHVLALDFDGVICDSSREVFVTAVDTYAEHEPASPLNESLRPLRDDALGGGDGFRSDPIYSTFLDLLPLGNRAEDFGVTLMAIEQSAVIPDQDAYDSFYHQIDPVWRDQFHRRFYEARNRLRDADLAAWLRLHLPYPGLAEMLGRHRGTSRLAVATAKDARSVELLLGVLGLAGIFESDLTLDKETGVEKTHHLRALHRRTESDYEQMTFVDDKVNHLVTVSPLGVRGVLAAWGFNSPREHELAEELGFEVARLDDAESILFKGE
jgi:phosphoglycolate phosphatase-like HAD superfamily hydrolase